MSRLEDWQFDLPDEFIASRPAERRDASRLMVLRPGEVTPADHVFSELPSLLQPGDLLVANDTRVMAARIPARRATGGRVEVLLLQPGPGVVEALCRPARRLKVGEVLSVDGGGRIEIVARPDDEGICRVRTEPTPAEIMASAGSLPLPPYIKRQADSTDSERYQTVFAGPLGAAAAPTAGLHFTPAVHEALADRGVAWATVTLHVGIGTFRPLRPEDLERGELHREAYEVPRATVDAIAAARGRGGRVIAVGTTSARTLESATPEGERVPRAGASSTRLFIRPPYTFRCTDGLITNFHLPGSSLLMLVAGLVGRERLLDAYRRAVQGGYRFYSYGDAMLLLPGSR